MTAIEGRMEAARETGLERRVEEIGRGLFAAIGHGPRIWERGWWDDRLMSLTMGDSATKVQLFRFIDALPMLREAGSVRRHLEEYLEEAGEGVPGVVRWPLEVLPEGAVFDRVLAWAARMAAGRMGRRFIAGSTPGQALETVRRLRESRLAFSADLLGEAVIGEQEAERYQRTCLELLNALTPALNAMPEVPQIDRDDRGPIPRCNLSLKLTSLVPRFDALHAETTSEGVLERLRPILRTARAVGAFVNVDMEQYAHKDLTYQLFRRVLEEPEFRDWEDVGVVCQAYLKDALGDLEELRDWAERRGVPVSVRLVKGAYWDYEVTMARQLGWPVPVYQEKWETDANYERCAGFLLENRHVLRPALGSHNVRSLASVLAKAESLGVPEDGFEVQMLYGMGEPIQKAIVDKGLRLRVYTPYGAMLPGMAYLVRRLLENTSNESFLRASSSGEVPEEELLRNPEEVGAMRVFNRAKRVEKVEETNRLEMPFRNEPLTDFSREENRARMRQAIEAVRQELGEERPLVIGGREIRTAEGLESRDPGDWTRVVGRTSRASREHADQAVRAAGEASARWAGTPVRERAAVLLRAAGVMRAKRFELAAWEVFECAKPWREADGDVAEAIDFCEYYAREMVRLDEGQDRNVPGETNALRYIPRGVAVVIPPWNFPLAIPSGMTAAALVAGNSVILKPAEQSAVMGWQLWEAFREAGLPAGVLNYLPGVGEEVGAALVDDPRVHVIAFTGSKAVGLEINRKASEMKAGQRHVKRVIAEMGGKNAIIVDEDADLDEAVVGVLQSAFGYAGQKCSACSRAIVLEGVHEAFLGRLREAAQALTVGSAEDPDTVVPPVIDAEARERILEYQRLAAREGRVEARVTAGSGEIGRGQYVPALIVSGVEETSRVAQEEIFGPVLAVMKVRDLDEALRVANATDYALTGGLYSRSPKHIERVKREFLVGNLYINRAITGALVDRQPFGGFRLSGLGTKAGGPEYLLEFLLPRTLTENTLRRGFAPEAEPETAGVERV